MGTTYNTTCYAKGKNDAEGPWIKSQAP